MAGLERELHPYNAALPNADAIRAESDKVVSSLVASFTKHVKDADSRGYYDLSAVMRDLKLLNHVKEMRYIINTDEWKTLIESMLSILFSDDADLHAQSRLLVAITTLLQAERHEQLLVVQWRPFYYALQKYHLHEINLDIREVSGNASHLQHLISCIYAVSRYFPPDAAREIADAFTPSLVDQRANAFFPAAACIRLFMPPWATIPMIGLETVQFWLETWAAVKLMPEYDAIWAAVFGRLAHPNRINLSFDWSKMIPFLFSRLLSAFQLPVEGRKAGVSKLPEAARKLCPSQQSAVAALIKLAVRLVHLPATAEMNAAFADMDFPEENLAEGGVGDASVMGYLERLLRLLQTHFYPTAAQAGYFSSVLRVIVGRFVDITARYQAAKKIAVIGQAAHITSSHAAPVLPVRSDAIDRFVDLALPLAILGLYLPRANRGSWSLGVAKTLKDLAVLAPGKVTQEVVNMALQALDPSTVNQTHIGPNALEALGEAIPALLFPVPHIAPSLPALLQLALPGIDPNDDKKTISTISFFGAVLEHVPLVDAADARDWPDAPKLPSWHEASEDYFFRGLEGLLPAAASNEELSELMSSCREIQIQLTEWALLVLERVLKILETRGKPAKKKGGQMFFGAGGDDESENFQVAVSWFISVLFGQMSQTLRKQAIGRLFNWFTSMPSLENPKLAMQTLEAVAAVEPSLMTHKFVVYYLDCAEHAASTDLVVWYLQCLTGVVRGSGEFILPFVPALTTITNRVYNNEEQSARSVAGKLLRALLKTLLEPSLRPTSPSYTARDLEDTSVGLWFKYAWGYRWDLALPAGLEQVKRDAMMPPIELQWCIPTTAMKDAAQTILGAIVVPAISKLEAICAGRKEALLGTNAEDAPQFAPTMQPSDRLKSLVQRLIAVVRGAGASLTDSIGSSGDDNLFMCHSAPVVATWHELTRSIHIDAASRVDHTSLRSKLMQLITKLGASMESDALFRDPKSINLILKLTRFLVTFRGMRKSKVKKAIDAYAASQKNKVSKFRNKQLSKIRTWLIKSAGLTVNQALSFEEQPVLDIAAGFVELQFASRRAEAARAVPRAMHFGAADTFQLGDEEGEDDDEEAAPVEAGPADPLVTQAMGLSAWQKAKAAEHDYLRLMALTVKLAETPYDAVRRKAVGHLSVMLTVFGWFRHPLQLRSLEKMEQLCERGTFEHYELLGHSAMSMPQRTSTNLDYVGRFISVVLRCLTAMQSLPVDKQQTVLQQMAFSLAKVSTSWRAPRMSLSNPKRSKYEHERAALLTGILQALFGSGEYHTGLLPPASLLVTAADGSSTATKAPLRPPNVIWRVEVALGCVAFLLLASDVDNQVHPLHMDTAAAANVGDGWEEPELVWLWALTSCLSSTSMVRTWGFHTLALLLWRRNNSVQAKAEVRPLPVVDKFLSDPASVSQLVMAASFLHPGSEQAQDPLTRLFSFRLPCRFESGCGLELPADAITQPVAVVLFEQLAWAYPATIQLLEQAIDGLCAETGTKLSSGNSAVHDNATLRQRHATTAEVLAGVTRFMAGNHVGVSGTEHHDVHASYMRLLSAAALPMHKSPLAWKADWGYTLRLSAMEVHASKISPLLTMTAENAYKCLKLFGRSDAASASLAEDAVVSTFAPVTRWTYFTSCLYAELSTVHNAGEMSTGLPGVLLPGSPDSKHPRMDAVDFVSKLLPSVLEHFSHPYKACRDVASAFVADVLELDGIRRRAPASLMWAADVLRGSEKLRDVIRDALASDASTLLVANGRRIVDVEPSEKSTATESFADALFNLLHHLAQMDMNGDGELISGFLPVLLRFQSYPKKEISGLAQLVLGGIAQALDFSHEIILDSKASVSAACARALRDTVSTKDVDVTDKGEPELSWSARKAAMQFLTPVSARGSMVFTRAASSDLLSLAESALLDKQPEVQEAAAHALAAIVATFSVHEQELIANKYVKLTSTKLPQGAAPIPSAEGATAEELLAYKEFKRKHTRAVHRRYAGVLGASAVIRAHPFDIPPYLPSVLSTLARNVSDPQPVSTAVRKLFTEFKHTHQDNWEAHKLAFTPDQLVELVELLVSPHYYA